MKISANITKLDLFKMNLSRLIRWNTLFWFMFLYICIIYRFVFIEDKFQNCLEIVFIVSFFVTILVYLIIWLVTTAVSIALQSQSNATLGEHIFTLNAEAFVEETSTNTTITKWSGIYNLKKTRFAILVYISRYLVHVIPKSSFKNADEFDDFYNKIEMYRKNA